MSRGRPPAPLFTAEEIEALNLVTAEIEFRASLGLYGSGYATSCAIIRRMLAEKMSAPSEKEGS